ncbi:MAG TPA: type II secretion system protein GspM [Anaerovoracaceae bacterium]|nr:type II secretion system protein GspM [Anaerovoracaceae bacterium]
MSTLSKMNGRDRNLLILVVAAIVFYFCYNFVMAPYKASTEALQAELGAAQSELARVQELSGKEEELKKQEADLKDEINDKYAAFLTDIDQSRILYRVDSLAMATGFPITDYSPSPDMVSQVSVETGFYAPQGYPLKDLAVKINPTDAEDEAGQEGASAGQEGTASGQPSSEAAPAAVESEDMIPGTDITMGFKAASYESIYSFIGQVENMNKTAFLRGIDIRGNAGSLEGQMIFSFYSLPPFDPKMKDGLDFSPAIPTGKANPFN